MIGAFIKQKNTVITGLVKGMGAIKIGKKSLPAVVAVTCHGCECVIPVQDVEVVTPAPEKQTSDFDGVLQYWAIDHPERLDKALGLLDTLWAEYDRLTPTEKDGLPVWLGRALAEMARGW